MPTKTIVRRKRLNPSVRIPTKRIAKKQCSEEIVNSNSAETTTCSESSASTTTTIDDKFTVIVAPRLYGKRKPEDQPKMTKIRVKNINGTVTTIPIQNRFEPIAPPSDDPNQVEDEEESMETQDQETRETEKVNTPTPIVLHGKPDNYDKLTKMLREKAAAGYNLKFTSTNTQIQTKRQSDKEAIMKALKENGTDFHTYTEKGAITHAFVIRGLDNNPDPDEIKLELEEYHKIKVVKIYRMKATRRPLYMVTTSADTKLSQLLKNVQFLYNTKVSWERHINNKQIIQCHRCQMWGHATSNCFATPRCLKCADNHLTYNCQKAADTPAKCYNCNEDHPANSVDCQAYKDRLEFIENNRARNSTHRRNTLAQKLETDNSRVFPKYQPAPLPKHNPWTRNAPLPGVSTEPSGREIPIIRTQEAPQSSKATRPEPATGSSEFQELQDEFTKLKANMNIGNMLIALKDYNKLLSSCKTAQEKFTTTLSFLDNIESYGI